MAHIYRTHNHGASSDSGSSGGSNSRDTMISTRAGVGSTTCTDLPFIPHSYNYASIPSDGWGGMCIQLEMHVMMMLWKKLAVNCDAIDPLTTIHNVTNGQLFSLDDIEPIMLRKS